MTPTPGADKVANELDPFPSLDMRTSPIPLPVIVSEASLLWRQRVSPGVIADRLGISLRRLCSLMEQYPTQFRKLPALIQTPRFDGDPAAERTKPVTLEEAFTRIPASFISKISRADVEAVLTGVVAGMTLIAIQRKTGIRRDHFAPLIDAIGWSRRWCYSRNFPPPQNLRVGKMTLAEVNDAIAQMTPISEIAKRSGEPVKTIRKLAYQSGSLSRASHDGLDAARREMIVDGIRTRHGASQKSQEKKQRSAAENEKMREVLAGHMLRARDLWDRDASVMQIAAVYALSSKEMRKKIVHARYHLGSSWFPHRKGKGRKRRIAT